MSQHLRLDKARLKAMAVIGVGLGGLVLIAGTVLSGFHRFGLPLIGLGGLAVTCSLGFLLFLNLRLHQDLIERQLRAIQSAVALSSIHLDRPVFLSRHAVAPDFVEIVAEIIRRTSARRVLELGCGSSSLYVTALLAQSGGSGVLVCLEDNPGWVELVQSEIDSLLDSTESGVVARVIHAPLVTTREQPPFYDLDAADLGSLGPFDLLIVDGPSDVQLRRSAWPLLKDLLSPSAFLILDDGDSIVIREVVRSWLSQAGSWKAVHYPTVKGTWVVWNGECSLQVPLP